MIQITEIRSLSDFQDHAAEHVKRLSQTGQPEVLTIDGEAILVVQDAAAYQKLLDQAQAAETAKLLKQRSDEMKRGGGIPFEQWDAQMRSKHNIPRSA